jgi:catechol 2,3-dioxygenase-like lactoylglutathione lyase family enzyme
MSTESAPPTGSHARYPTLRQVVIDCEDARALAEFYRELLGYRYRAGDEPPPLGEPDANGQDWLVLRGEQARQIAFQQVDSLPPPTWPSGDRPQMMHLDMSVPDVESLDLQHARAQELGARLLLDRSADPVEPLYVYADPAGHPFCVFVAAPPS